MYRNLIKTILHVLFLSSCEYQSKVTLSDKAPLVVNIDDKSVIKRMDISEKLKGDQYYHSIFKIEFNSKITKVLLDTLIRTGDSLQLTDFYVPYKEYSIYIKTDKGSAATYFRFDSIQNVIVKPL